MKRNFTLTILVLLSACVAQAQSKKEVVEVYLRQLHRDSLFNGNALVVEGGQELLRVAIGQADASGQKPLRLSDRFHIGSVSKEFDAIGIMILVEQGKLSLDDTIAKFWPELPSWARKVQVRHILQYTSGLPEVRYRTIRSDADNWKDLQSLQALEFEPGTKYAYNNNNTFLRRQLIEKVTGKSFKVFVEEVIAAKAGLKAAIVDPTDSDPDMAKSFNASGKQDPLRAPISGWTCLDLEDCLRWAKAVESSQLLRAESTRFLLTPFEPGKQAGLGSGTMEGDQVITHLHDGVSLQYQALLATDRTRGRAIILLTNQKHNNILDIAAKIQAILDEK